MNLRHPITTSRLSAAAFSLQLWALLLASVVLLAGCASAGNRAPVEDRKPPAAKPLPPAPGSVPALLPGADGVVKPPPPGIENAGKPGYYTVKQGDTLIRVGLDAGQNWRDIARWNALENPNVIEVGQVLRVVPPAPAAESPVVTVRPVAPVGPVVTRPLDGRPVAADAAAAAAQKEGDEDVNWAWPAVGPVVMPFDDNKSKGLAIAGKAGDPVFATADGRVVYAGAGLRGYGNLIIVKHNTTYLSAYAHNQTLLVKEDQVVRRGQKIAEMGNSDADRVQLHFEIRRGGKPIDPAKLLPSRP